MIEISNGDYTMAIDPSCGGSVASLGWRGQPILRTQSGSGVLESACFPLVPFCNRIADNRFEFAGRDVTLSPNHPGNPDDLVLHGFGWTSSWNVEAVEPARAQISLEYPGGAWPWPFRAEQTFSFDRDAAKFALALTNLSDEPMPAGLGFHPYFPIDDRTFYMGLHTGEWQADERILPGELVERDESIDWWHGAPIGARQLDTVYAGRDGPLTLEWRGGSIGAEIGFTPDLRFTHVYVPPSGDYCCIEPVSQIGDAFNQPDEDRGFRTLDPGETWTVAMTLRAYPLSAP
jgi:aldose 1-epimerase